MTRPNSFSYLAPSFEKRYVPALGGYGVFAAEPVPSGAVVASWGGETLSADQIEPHHTRQSQLLIQVEEDLFLFTPPERLGPADAINHSCDPNAGVLGQVTLVALRDIQAGEELCYDYAMTDGSPYDQFECRCGSPSCRHMITGNDWQIPALWERYQQHFSPYLLRRIKRLRAAQPGINGRHTRSDPTAITQRR
jgi:uncharacterized protein